MVGVQSPSGARGLGNGQCQWVLHWHWQRCQGWGWHHCHWHCKCHCMLWVQGRLPVPRKRAACFVQMP